MENICQNKSVRELMFNGYREFLTDLLNEYNGQSSKVIKHILLTKGPISAMYYLTQCNREYAINIKKFIFLRLEKCIYSKKKSQLIEEAFSDVIPWYLDSYNGDMVKNNISLKELNSGTTESTYSENYAYSKNPLTLGTYIHNCTAEEIYFPLINKLYKLEFDLDVETFIPGRINSPEILLIGVTSDAVTACNESDFCKYLENVNNSYFTEYLDYPMIDIVSKGIPLISHEIKTFHGKGLVSLTETYDLIQEGVNITSVTNFLQTILRRNKHMPSLSQIKNEKWGVDGNIFSNKYSKNKPTILGCTFNACRFTDIPQDTNSLVSPNLLRNMKTISDPEIEDYIPMDQIVNGERGSAYFWLFDENTQLLNYLKFDKSPFVVCPNGSHNSQLIQQAVVYKSYNRKIKIFYTWIFLYSADSIPDQKSGQISAIFSQEVNYTDEQLNSYMEKVMSDVGTYNPIWTRVWENYINERYNTAIIPANETSCKDTLLNLIK